MIHGGVRYLENGEFRLVKESVTERNRLVRNAPHFVRPLPTTIPIHRTISGILTAPFRLLVTHGRGKPSERGALLIKLGLVMYDTFSRDGGAVPRHRFHGRRRSRELFPDLDDRFRYTATYYDASMHDPERLALDVLRDGAGRSPRAPRTTRPSSAPTARRSSSATPSPARSSPSPPTSSSTRAARGPTSPTTLWAPHPLHGRHEGLAHRPREPELLEATRGNEIFFEAADGRIVLIYPLKGRVMVGTTDIDADPSTPTVCTDDEISYFFDLIAQVFPHIAVDRSQIVYTFSGIRPLPRHDDVAPGFVSRDYRIEKARWAGRRSGDEPGRRQVDDVPRPRRAPVHRGARRARASAPDLDARSRDRRRRRIPAHRRRPLPLARGPPRSAQRRVRRSHAGALRHLRDRDARNAAGQPAPARARPGYSAEEIAFLAEREEVVTLIDLLLRRTHIAFVGGVTAETSPRSRGGGPGSRVGCRCHRAQIDDAARELQERHRIDVEHLAPLSA
jgi:glycerol-3-phosphate dehydrogenase